MIIEKKIIPPTMPNYVHFEEPIQPREQGFNPGLGYPITKFTVEQAHEFAQLMYDEFIKHWQQKTKQ